MPPVADPLPPHSPAGHDHPHDPASGSGRDGSHDHPHDRGADDHRAPQDHGPDTAHDHGHDHPADARSGSHDHDHDHDHDHPAHAHGGSHDHGHAHSHAPEITSRNERVVLIAFVITFVFAFAEVAGGLMSGSLALIADAGHMLTDAASLALAWAGFRFGRRAPDAQRSFGYLRLEVLAAFVNALALILLVGWIAYEAVLRLLTPTPILVGPMFVIAVLGLAVNIGMVWMLTRGDHSHVNIRGALLHVIGDLLGSVAAILAAVVIWLTGWTQADPILSLLLSALVLRGGWSLLKSSLHILMEGTPQEVDIPAMRADLRDRVPGLAGVDHVHVWSITSGRVMATMTAALAEGADPAAVTAALKRRLAEAHGIGHSTVEIDWDGSARACAMARPEAAP